MGLLGPAHHYCGQYHAVMNDLKAIAERDYFVVTSNGEGHFELSGFDPTKIYEIEGNWFMQCARPCHDTFILVLEVAENYRLPNRRPCTYRIGAVLSCAAVPYIHMGAGQRMIRIPLPRHGSKTF